jgi:hypothetical protein
MGKFQKLRHILGTDEIDIPINDLDAWKMYPEYRWIYNKMEICKFQKIDYAPMPIEPSKYPVILKPITNLYGMGLNVHMINCYNEFQERWYSNSFWMEYFEGNHYSFDLVILLGEIKFTACLQGHKGNVIGKFTHWESVNRVIPSIVRRLVKETLKTYSGCLNVEVIDGRMIECHLRMGDIDQFPTLKILQGIIATYQNKDYDWDIKLDKIYFFPIWGDTDVRDILKERITPKLEYNEYVCDFDIDDPSLASPSDEIRVMWLTCGDYDYGLSLVKSIEDIIKN